MKSFITALASGTASLALLACSPSEALGSSKGLGQALVLPTDGAVTYHNKALNTSFREACKANTRDKSVSCTLDVFGLTSKLEQTVYSTYKADKAGNIKVTSKMIDMRDTQAIVSDLYENARDSARAYKWGAQSHLAYRAPNGAIVQSDAVEISKADAGGVVLCSDVPINEKRGITICNFFDGATRTVQSVAMPRVDKAGGLTAVFTQKDIIASRDFDYKNDERRMNKYSAFLNGEARAYMLEQR